jgi:hypothetical protein
MTHYQQLSSEKHYHDAVTHEIKELGRQKNRQAVHAFGQFLFALVVFLFTVSAVHQMPVWLPMVTEFLEQNGITATFQSWVNQLR